MYVVQYEVDPGATTPCSRGCWMKRKPSASGRNVRQVRDALTAFLEARGLLSKREGQTRGILEALLRFLGASAAEIVLMRREVDGNQA